MRIAVVGGGILGVATARALAREHDVVLLEKESALARHQSSRNSGVVHAGIYYAAGSLKARLCRAGGARLPRSASSTRSPTSSAGRSSSRATPASSSG